MCTVFENVSAMAGGAGVLLKLVRFISLYAMTDGAAVTLVSRNWCGEACQPLCLSVTTGVVQLVSYGWWCWFGVVHFVSLTAMAGVVWCTSVSLSDMAGVV